MTSRSENLALPPEIKYQELGTVEAQQLIDSFIERIERRDAPEAGTLNDFFPLVKDALESKQNAENVPADKRLLFVEEDPPEALDTEAITFFLDGRVNGSYSRGRPGEGRVRELTPHLRGQVEHPDHPGEQLLILGKFWDNTIKFNIYAMNNKQARERLLWFENVMLSYRWYFAHFGYRVFETGVGSRERVEVNDRKLTKYPVVFELRTEDIVYLDAQELKRISYSGEAKF